MNHCLQAQVRHSRGRVVTINTSAVADFTFALAKWLERLVCAWWLSNAAVVSIHLCTSVNTSSQKQHAALQRERLLFHQSVIAIVLQLHVKLYNLTVTIMVHYVLVQLVD